jgi:alkylmercury lyase-like protein
VYRHLVETTRPPDLGELAATAGVDETEAAEALRRLADQHAIVLQPNSTDVWMAHPFSGVETPFPVAARGRTYFANCAWDAAGILSIVGDGRCQTHCGDCGDTLEFLVTAGALQGHGVVHFAVPVRRFWDDIAFT